MTAIPTGPEAVASAYIVRRCASEAAGDGGGAQVTCPVMLDTSRREVCDRYAQTVRRIQLTRKLPPKFARARAVVYCRECAPHICRIKRRRSQFPKREARRDALSARGILHTWPRLPLHGASVPLYLLSTTFIGLPSIPTLSPLAITC